ncbi:toll-like receptor 4 [Haliotis rubra]|uniref:toll-like receptor 4 n=1 Tax=Haliotis rubra TaxID=36100 RepID=UPI001EE6004E|nr:toll-like receptor 4 [Haliotis rubra]
MMLAGIILIFLVISTSLSHDTILNVTLPENDCCIISFEPIHGGTVANCTYQGLTKVPACLPGNTTTLLLSHNRIVELPNRAFQHVSVLKGLDLSFNGLKYISAGSFYGLSQLEILNLQSNRLRYDNNTFTPALFDPLTSLLKLSINHNSNNSPYPDASLSRLTTLVSLHMDGSHYDFGQGFRQLKNLTNLTLSGSNRGFCNIQILRNTTFSNVPFLKYVNISSCNISDTEPLTFRPLKGLHTVDVSHNPRLGFENFSKASFGLGGSAINVLKLNYVYPPLGCHKVSTRDFQYLNTTNLEELYVDGNDITHFDVGSISSLPKTLKFISAKENRFAYGRYLLELDELKSLEKIDLSFMNLWPPLQDNSLSVPVPLPPKLHTIVADNCFVTGQWGNIRLAKNTLKRVVMRYDLLIFLTIHIDGITSLEYIDLSHNILSKLASNVITENNSITHLNFSNNFLSQTIQSDNDGNTFHHLHRVKQFDISKNVITSLPRNIFRGLKRAEILQIRGNFLQQFEATLKPMPFLSYLDLSNNKLQRLSKDTLKELDMLPNVTVNLQGNPIQCSCQGLGFLRWMKRNLYKLSNLSQMTCQYDNASSISMSKLHQIVEELESECKHANAALGVVTASSCICIVLIICVALGYRHRWSIRYMYHVGRRRFWRNRQVMEDTQYQYDVFVSYAEFDRHIVIQEMIPELETKAGLRMCIHQRDFLPGQAIASNIVNAIENSRKTLIVLSPAFLTSDWCVFEYQIALQSRVTRRQDNLLVLMYEHVPVKDLPKEMAVLLSNNSYIEYNTDVYGRDAFWQSLVESLKTAQPLE